MRIAVMGGGGGLGGYFGAILARSSNEVHLIARGPSLEAIRRDGLRLITTHEDFTIRVHATDDPSQIGPVDLVLFCVKSYDTLNAAQAIKPLLGDDGCVLTVQNGIESHDRIEEVLGSNLVLPGAAIIASKVQAPGVIRQLTETRKIIFGEINGTKSARAEKVCKTLNDAGIDAELTDQVLKVLWRKMVLFCATSGMTSLLRLPMGDVMSHPESRAMFTEIMEEAAAVAKAGGVDVGAAYVQEQAEFAKTIEKGATSSMMRDLLEGKKLEVDSIQGTIVRNGVRLGVQAPMNKAVYAALKPYEGGRPRA